RSTTRPRWARCTPRSGMGPSRTTARISATTTAAGSSPPGWIAETRCDEAGVLKRYLARRLLIAVPSLLIATAIVFTLPRLIPGDAVQLMLAETSYAKDIDELRAKLGLDRPFHVQYVEWLGRAARGDLGESLWTRRPVLAELAQRLPVTAELAVYATLIALIIALPVGVLAAARQDSAADYVARSLAILGLSVPGFWLATLLIVLPALWR